MFVPRSSGRCPRGRRSATPAAGAPVRCPMLKMAEREIIAIEKPYLWRVRRDQVSARASEGEVVILQ